MVEFVNIGTLAGNGRLGDRGDGGSALDAELNRPHGLAIAPDGSICFTEYFGACVRRMSMAMVNAPLVAVVVSAGGQVVPTGGHRKSPPRVMRLRFLLPAGLAARASGGAGVRRGRPSRESAARRAR